MANFYLMLLGWFYFWGMTIFASFLSDQKINASLRKWLLLITWPITVPMIVIYVTFRRRGE